MMSASHRKRDSREALVRWLRDRSSGGRTSHSGSFDCRSPILDCTSFPRFSIESRQSKSSKNIGREYSSAVQRRWGAMRLIEFDLAQRAEMQLSVQRIPKVWGEFFSKSA